MQLAQNGVGFVSKLIEAGVANVTLGLPSDSAREFVQTATAAAGQRMSALLFVDGYTATLSVVGADGAATHLIAAEPVRGEGPAPALSTLRGGTPSS